MASWSMQLWKPSCLFYCFSLLFPWTPKLFLCQFQSFPYQNVITILNSFNIFLAFFHDPHKVEFSLTSLFLSFLWNLGPNYLTLLDLFHVFPCTCFWPCPYFSVSLENLATRVGKGTSWVTKQSNRPSFHNDCLWILEHLILIFLNFLLWVSNCFYIFCWVLLSYGFIVPLLQNQSFRDNG